MDKAKALLVDYTKSNSNWTLFWTGHWNRHYIKEVQTILNNMDTTNPNIEKPIADIEALMDALDEINPKNLADSLAKRMKFIRQLSYESKYQFEIDKPEEATCSCFSNTQ